jgi:hypothetical protein
MRVRTAVGTAAAIIVAKGAITWFAAKAWLAIPGRHWPPNRWHIDLGNLSEALAAFAAAGAAFVALWIAGRDRRDRKQEREDEEKTHARLVRVNIEQLSAQAVLLVKVRNFGPVPVLDVTVTDATWSEHPTARFQITREGRRPVDREQSILKPWQSDQTYEESIQYHLVFLHPNENTPLAPLAERQYSGGPTRYAPIDLSKVVAKVQFTTANGVRWETPTKDTGAGEPVRQ